MTKSQLLVSIRLLVLCLLVRPGPGLLESQPKYNFEAESSEEIFAFGRGNGNGTDVGISPPVLNLATKAVITVNATCGEKEPETFCKLVEHVHSRTRPTQCQVCDAMSSGKRHPIKFTIDGSNRWWQSPTLQNGRQYEWVTITIDLKQVYQVAYIIIKAANSPRPGNWILERSLDGVHFLPWQYYAASDDECINRYGIPARVGKPAYHDDEEVICTSYFSKVHPFEGGEIHTSLVNGRPGADGPSESVTKFTMARYVRFRLQKIRTLFGDLMSIGDSMTRNLDKSVMRRHFYSIKDISIGGHCVCFGHASECVMDGYSQTEKCMCQHNTCGDRCDVCCPLFNQYEWGQGNSTDSAACEACQCHGHADACVYDPEIHAKGLSINTFGTFDGGGVCLNCKHFTAGINCEKCQPGYFRPSHVLPNDTFPCSKCNCDSAGSMGKCVGNEGEGNLLSKRPGDCICKEGYDGKNCDKCSMGYRSYPNCEPCPCHLPGIVNSDCQGECICKENVDGKLCSQCKKGFFNLILENPDGCTQCFCHGITDECVSSNFGIAFLQEWENWTVSDLHGTKVISPVLTGEFYHVANEEFAHLDNYYWVAPKKYGGTHLLSYGLQMIFHVAWVQARGDTSGRPIAEHDLIIQSTTSMLAFSHNVHEGTNATIHVTLSDINCVVLPDVDNNIIQTKGHPIEPVPCTRYDVMEGLSNVKRLLLRAKYHTDQIEGVLQFARLELANTSNVLGNNGTVASSVELCSCPIGYSGTSCEQCAYGYRKSSKEWLNECLKCDCNGHSATCDLNGVCGSCDHNTTGDRCKYCESGFYGDPKSSISPNACKRCECPLAIETNNFSPECTLLDNSYQCTACPAGYDGPFCERCANGYYGNPTQPGDYCKPCACTGEDAASPHSDSNTCDHLTGECLVCPKNTVGWNCDECMVGYFGNPLNGSCIPCDCNAIGCNSVNCNSETGQCPCKESFTGRKCNECLEGHGSPQEGCPICSCNVVGAMTTDCNSITGQCVCKPGVGGRYCNKCLDLHFGFSMEGCTACDCHPDGSDSIVCDLNTGQCHCLPNVRGRKCDDCSPGFWGLNSGQGCEKCSCDPIGSLGNVCDMTTGQCACKPGVTGSDCSRCDAKFYGFSASGCKACDPCPKEGHVCDPESGSCICPPNTEGNSCEKCTIGFWGYSFKTGCEACNCSQQGATTPQCAADTGKCQCLPGFETDRCNVCKFGHYNYPTCSKCDCDPSGTIEKYCDSNGVCSCSDRGQCPCKPNVAGQKCDRCKDGFYGMEKGNEEGCMECFCFQRSSRCSQGFFKWQRLEPPSNRVITPTKFSENQFSNANNLIVIPDQVKDVLYDKDMSFSAPLYWQLPHIFLGDKVLSYNGFLRFKVESKGNAAIFPTKVLSSYPLVQIRGNHRLILEHFVERIRPNGFHEVKLHEDHWRLKHGAFNGLVTKEVMMIALQNLQHILIRGTHTPEISNATLYNVSLDIAIPSPTGDKSMAHGIEVCECPPEYNSTSCQNPRIGYYRWYKRDYITSTVIIDLIGEAKPCECNGRSQVCDTESGHCLACSENTAGPRCETCALGFYGNPLDSCLPCPCPSIWNNHADSCYKSNPFVDEFLCYCRQGYTGKSCDRCDYGYYGSPWEKGGYCQACKCNPYGSVSDECHEITGQCNCRFGVTGRDCSKCSDRHVIIGKACTSCDDQCTGVLLNDADWIQSKLGLVNVDPEVVTVWKRLALYDNESMIINRKFSAWDATNLFLEDLPTRENLAEMMKFRSKELFARSEETLMDATEALETSEDFLVEINLINNDVRSSLLLLQDYVEGKIIPSINPIWAQGEANTIVEGLKAVSIDLKAMVAGTKDELDANNLMYEAVLTKIFNASVAHAVRSRIKSIRDKLEDLMDHIGIANKNSDNATRISAAANELLQTRRINIQTIENLTMKMDLDIIVSGNQISDGKHLLTESDQVILMIEDILKDLRNITKEVEIRDNTLHDIVPLYRVEYCQPAFDHAELLRRHAEHMERVLNSIRINGSEQINGVTAYERMKEGFDLAFEIASNATTVAQETSQKIRDVLSQFSLDDMSQISTRLIQSGLTLTGTVENFLRNNLTAIKSTLDDISWQIKSANETLRTMFNDMEEFDQNLRVDELMTRIDEIANIVQETSMTAMDLESKIDVELQGRIDSIKDGTAFDSVDVAVQVSSVQTKLGQISYILDKVESRSKETGSDLNALEDKMKNLRALIKQSRHKANTVRVSIGPDETGTCFRLFQWPVMDSATSVKFNFAPTQKSDSLLFYWPSSLNDDFIAIEMISSHIRATWDLGSGVHNLTHPRKFTRISENSEDPDFWVTISFERVGSFVALDVQGAALDKDKRVGPKSSAVSYGNTEEEATLLTLAPEDLIHIGGMSKQMRPGLVSNGMGGCIHNLQVNHRSLGLWNFVGNEGCAPCVECPDSLIDMHSSNQLEYYFDGRGYSVVNRIQSKAFNSKFFDLTMEFRTYSENALLFLTVNETVGQVISIELREGRVVLQVRHSWKDASSSLRIESNGDTRYNTGKWVEVRAIWLCQRGKQTGQITVDKKNYKQEKPDNGFSLELYNAAYHLGGVSPAFDTVKWQDVVQPISYVGCMKNILIDSAAYDPLSGLYHGVESPCSGKSVYTTSFEGDGYVEFSSRPMDKDFKFGFSFKTLAPTGLMILSTSARSLDDLDGHYYAVYLENGQIRVQIGIPLGPIDLMSNGTRYDDGKFHSFRFVKKNRRLFLYMDDEELVDTRLPKKSPTVSAPEKNGLFIGGTNTEIQEKFGETPLPVTRGFAGCIQNFYFGNELLNFNYPIAYQNQHLGQCPSHNDYTSSVIPSHFLFHFRNFDPLTRFHDPSCSAHPDSIEQEEPLKALQFGDSPDSYATIVLDGNRSLKQRFNLTFQFRSYYPNGIFFQGVKKKGTNGNGYCLMSFLKDGQIIVKLHGGRPQDLVSPITSLNDGQWHRVSIVKADDKMYLYVDSANATQTKVPKLKAISRLNVGGVPTDGQDCLENSIQKPEYFKGCMRNFVINSQPINLDKNGAILHQVNPCFHSVESGTFFRTGSFAIYSHNVTVSHLMELQLEFRSDSKNGLLLAFVPSHESFRKLPYFSIFLEDGKVIARETISSDEMYEAVADFGDSQSEEGQGYVCNGNWHTIRANYEKGSITLRIDNLTPIFALSEPVGGSREANPVSGSLFIGGIEDGASRSTKQNQFHGCIRNISVNRQRRDWTDMALLANVFLNSCPL